MPTNDVPQVLFVEDDRDTRLLLQHLLEDSHEITFASDVESVRGALETEEFDLVFLDIHLGTKQEQGGVELLRMIRKFEDADSLPAVAVTAYAMPGDREDLLGKGFDQYLGKPFTRGELQRTVEEALSSTEHS